MWIDSHCHLTHSHIEELGTPEVLVSEAKAKKIDGILTISCQIKGDFTAQLAVAQAHENVWCSVGTHPHDSGLKSEMEVTQEALVDIANSDKANIIGIGESGLDHFYNNSPRDVQEVSFRKHIRASIEAGLPLIVHTRDADNDTMRILREEGAGDTNLKGLIHCFSSGAWLAEQALDIGFYLSFSGIVTFKKATEIHDVAKNAPADRILVETDAPFLAPVPYRGKLNHPAYAAHTGGFLADLRGVDVENFAEQTSKNFFALFNRAKMV